MSHLHRRLMFVCAVLALWIGGFGQVGAGLQTSPVWYGASAAASSTWHYRVPLTLSAAPGIGATAVFNVDFAALLTQLGISGTLDVNSPRVVQANGVLVPTQEFTDAVYSGATDPVGNGRGEVRFLAPTTATVYYLYFDITANGAKAVNTAIRIGGNFENSSTGTQTPPGWTLVRAASAIDSQIRPSENPSVTTDGALKGNGTPIPKTVDGTPFTGAYSYLLGSRTSNETATATNVVQLSRAIVVPATNPGTLTFRYRVQGWDSNDNGVTGTYDYLSVTLVDGAATTQIVGPSANNYVTAPFSPNKGAVVASTTVSGYGQYNGFDTTTTGTHKAGMTVARGAQPWWTVSVNLAAFAGKTVTLKFATSHTVQYRSWWHLDEVEWSLASGTVGAPQGFGAALELPQGASTVYAPGDALAIRARLDAVGLTGSVVADLYRPNGTLAAGGMVLYNNATRGDTTAADALWTNMGVTVGSPTYTFAANDQLGVWTVVLRAADSSGAAGGQPGGLIRVPGQPVTPITGSNFSNVDVQTLTFVPDSIVSGKVFVDNGAGGATALDGMQSASEAPLAGTEVRLLNSGGGVLSRALVRGDGQFDLVIPSSAAGTSVTVSLPAITGYTLVRLGVGTTAGTATIATGSVTFSAVAHAVYSGVAFSELSGSTLTAGQAKTSAPGGVVTYAHRFTAGANGAVSFTLTSQPPPTLASWVAVLYRDTACNGTIDNGASPMAGPVTVAAGDFVCVVVHDIVPAAAALSTTNQHTLSATLGVTEGIGYSMAAISNLDVTTVGAPSGAGLSLIKAVRNVTTSSPFATSGQALPGQSLQYRITFQNDTATAVSGVQIYDSVPAYALFGGASCGSIPAGLTCAVSLSPANGAATGAIAWTLTGPVPPGSSGTVTFDWTLKN